MQQRSESNEINLNYTVSITARDFVNRYQTKKNLLSTATGQGNLPAWIELELVDAPVGSQFRWKISPKDRPASIANDPQLPRNSLIWLELELLERRENNMLSSGVTGCTLISQLEVQSLFERWNQALQTKDPEKVARLYSRDAILLPTLSDVPRTNHKSIVDYFSHFLEKHPKGSVVKREILIGCNMLQDAGLYTFTFADGSSAEARYSFIYILEDSEWKISHHHSSLQPD